MANEEDEMSQKVQEELNLTLNPTSLLDNSGIIKKSIGGHDSILNSDNRSGTADFLGLPAKNPYGQ